MRDIQAGMVRGLSISYRREDSIRYGDGLVEVRDLLEISLTERPGDRKTEAKIEYCGVVNPLTNQREYSVAELHRGNCTDESVMAARGGDFAEENS